MIRICTIGGIGSGKSFISKLFKYPVFNADNVVKNIYRNDKNCFKNLKKKLPKFISSFPVKKSDLIKAISSNRNNLRIISSIVHPIVRKKMKFFLKENKSSRIVVMDIPLLIENKLYKKNDILVFVKTKKSKILKRLKKRRNFNKKILNELKLNQSSLLKKERMANYIIDNNFSPNIMKNKIKKLKEKIIDERNSS